MNKIFLAIICFSKQIFFGNFRFIYENYCSKTKYINVSDIRCFVEKHEKLNFNLR